MDDLVSTNHSSGLQTSRNVSNVSVPGYMGSVYGFNPTSTINPTTRLHNPLVLTLDPSIASAIAANAASYNNLPINKTFGSHTLSLDIHQPPSPPTPPSQQIHHQLNNSIQLRIHPSPINTYHTTNFTHNSVQGPLTREYFGHDNITYNENDQLPDQPHYQYSPPDISYPANYSTESSDVIEAPIDPYDNSAGEQRFCGGYGEWGHVVTHTERSILPDLKPYPFPDEIKNKADVIYNKMIYRVRRGKIRNQMLFFCVYCAHLELNRDINPIQLGSQFGLTPGEVQRCDSIFSPLQTGYRPPSTNTSPLRYLPEYCKEMELSEEAANEVMLLANNVLRKDPTLFQESPQTVAAGFLRYFTVTNGITTDDPQKIIKVTGRSNVTIEGMYRRIATIDNR